MAVLFQSISFLALFLGAGMGLFAVFAPSRAAAMMGFALARDDAISEMRAAVGAGLFAIHAPALIAAGFAMADQLAGPQEPPITAILAIVLGLPAALGWLLMAFTRIMSIFADKVGTKHNWLSSGFEFLLCCAILAPMILSLRR